MKTLRLALPLAILSYTSLNAALVTNIVEVGPDVVWTTTGSADLSALTFASPFPGITPGHSSGSGIFITGAAGDVDLYNGITSFVASFGLGGSAATSGVGPTVGIFLTNQQLAVPAGYLSGAPLASPSVATYSGTTIAALNLTPGSYVWSWGAGPTADSYTLNIGGSVIPEPSTYIAMAGFGALSAFLWRRRKVKAA